MEINNKNHPRACLGEDVTLVLPGPINSLRKRRAVGDPFAEMNMDPSSPPPPVRHILAWNIIDVLTIHLSEHLKWCLAESYITS